MSKIRRYFFFSLLILPTFIFPQIETVNPQNEIYDFLKILALKRVITDYDDIILPLSRIKIISLLKQSSESINLTSFEKEMIQREFLKYKNPDEQIGSNFLYNFKTYCEDPVYFFIHSDTVLNLQLNPIIEEKAVYSINKNASSNLFSFGGVIKGSYMNKFAFELKARNGIQSGDKAISLIDQDVKQSFTFNRVGINFFDYTEGYLRFDDQKINFEIGRKRILWGYGLDKINISGNAPIFDFIKFGADFNFLNINFLHGWLVQPLEYRYDSTESIYRKIKNPKYIAISRFGFHPSDFLSFGITQTIIYANRPFEAAYLNPFLFFESAQRTMNDLDNSFLGFDLKLDPIRGLQIVSEINFDDFDFKNINQNRYILEVNTSITSPLLPENLLFGCGIIKIDPYIYSHEGIGEALTYTNNSFLLGPNLQPNSLKFYFYLNYFLNSRFFIKAHYNRILHGANIYDENGKLLVNKGGNVFEPLRKGDSLEGKLLSGIREREDNFSISLNYTIIHGLYISINYQLKYLKSASHIFLSGIKFDL